MTIVTVMYPRVEGATFDFDYYQSTHLPLVAARWGEAGLTGAEAMKGLGAPGGGEAPFLAIALMRFGSTAAFEAALNGEHAAEIMGDIANFTNVQPVIQVNEGI